MRNNENVIEATLKAVGLLSASFMYPDDHGNIAMTVNGIDPEDPEQVGFLMAGLHNVCLILVASWAQEQEVSPEQILQDVAKVAIQYDGN